MNTIKVLTVLAVMLAASSITWAKIGGGDIVFHVKDRENAIFSHDLHVGIKGLKCNECHYRLYSTVAQHTKATMADMERGVSCGACHNGQRAFSVKGDCNRCHRQ